MNIAFVIIRLLYGKDNTLHIIPFNTFEYSK